MVKHHPKKKKGEKPDPKDSDNKDPPKEQVSEEEKIRTKRQLDTLYWLRVALAVLAGIAATFIFDSIEGEERRWASIGFMIVIFIVTIGIAKGMRMKLPSSDRKKIVTQAMGSYVFIYLFMWIMTYTLVYLPESESGIPTPFT